MKTKIYFLSVISIIIFFTNFTVANELPERAELLQQCINILKAVHLNKTAATSPKEASLQIELNKKSDEPNPLLVPSDLPFEAIPFDKIKDEHYQPAFEQSLKEAEQRLIVVIRQMSAAKTEPTYDDTINALEAVEEPFLFFRKAMENMVSLKLTDTLRDYNKIVEAKLTEFYNRIIANPIIFARVARLYEIRDSLDLKPSQLYFLTKQYRGFIRNGANLDEAGKKRITEIDMRLSEVTNLYSDNVLDATAAYQYVVIDEKRLSGLPADIIASAAKAAKDKNVAGWLFTISGSNYVAIQQYADDEALREEIWRARATLATSGKFDNRAHVVEITKLRRERAQLLGYKTHFHFTTEERMAQNPENLMKFVKRLAEVYKPAALRDLQELKEFAKRDIKPWDVLYYSEKLREARYAYSETELKPYLSYENVTKGLFDVTKTRFGLTFIPRTDIPVWHPLVKVYEVKDSDGSMLGLFYDDAFARPGEKRGGAWMNTLQDAGEFAGRLRRPHVLNSANINPPIEGEPRLLTPDEVLTRWHEMGHGLHGMLTKVQERNQSGPNVEWDAVELPSQGNEPFAFESEIMKKYATHYQTGEPIPDELIAKMKRAENFQAGISGLGQLRYIMLDLGWYYEDITDIKNADDVAAWELKNIKDYVLFTPIPGQIISTNMSHIMSGGYSGGYYSYKWAEALAADAYSIFKREGLLNPAPNMRFRKEILEVGGSRPSVESYQKFSGGNGLPDPDALLRKEGLIP